MKWALWLLTGLWLWLHPSDVQAKRVVYTIAIGNNAPPALHPELAPLRYADDDAARFYRLLAQDPGRSSLLTAFDKDTQVRHRALSARVAEPSFENLRASMLRFQAGMRADRQRGDLPVLFLTFSGHGATAASSEPALTLADAALTRTRRLPWARARARARGSSGSGRRCRALPRRPARASMPMFDFESHGSRIRGPTGELFRRKPIVQALPLVVRGKPLLDLGRAILGPYTQDEPVVIGYDRHAFRFESIGEGP